MKHNSYAPFLALAVLFVAVSWLTPAVAQSPAWQLTGFVNPHYYADSRAVVGGREDMMLFYPKPVSLDSNGNDINDGWQANLLAITARLGLRVQGPDVFGAKATAYIEGDFTGATNAAINNLRLRHAYFDLRWQHHRLLAGQYWYAMVVHEIMPMTNPLNMGAPFHCYARQPQVRYEYAAGGFEAVAVAQWQLDNMSQGLLNGQPASSTLFARHSVVPELTAQLRYRTGGLFVGVAVNAKTIQPMVQSVATAWQPSRQKYSSLSYSLFGKINLGPVTVKAQTLLNNSLYEGCSLGGYLMLADSSFADWHFNTVWLGIERNRGRWRPGIFAGYAVNTDSGNHADALHIFGRGHDIDYLWRVQPRLTYAASAAFSLTAEAEYTCAKYTADPEPVANLRLSLSATYAF
ncbi:MAG: hypothetical protein K5650_04595 [Bacteroidales bacterium]|nr:hypothetical protein [Bacteroidales bacterium]